MPKQPGTQTKQQKHKSAFELLLQRVPLVILKTHAPSAKQPAWHSAANPCLKELRCKSRIQHAQTHLEKNKLVDKHISQACLPTQFPHTTLPNPPKKKTSPTNQTNTHPKRASRLNSRIQRAQKHMPPRDTQTATHQLENDTFVNQFPHTRATKTTCHPQTLEKDALNDRNRTLNGEGAHQVHNCMTTTASCALSVCRKTL